LIVIQLAVIWGTYAVIERFKKDASKIEALKKSHLSAHPAATTSVLENLPSEKLRFVSGRQHANELRRVLQNAVYSVCVLSGWVSSNALTPNLVSLMEKALLRGVDLYIGYGYQNAAGIHEMRPWTRSGIETLQRLQSQCVHSKGRLLMREFANHEKILIMDDREVILGSHNWLSNNAFFNSERSIVVKSLEVARAERSRVTALVVNRSFVDQ
jgi:phosphatidylserine/phosphatidylglycerophosphate/cardiolipin synthase-like enzyme